MATVPVFEPEQFIDRWHRAWRLRETCPLFPEGPIDVALTDNPWWYGNRKTGGERKKKTRFGGGARKHYNLMLDSELRAFYTTLGRRLAERSVLFMWATMPRLPLALELIQLAGMRYATNGFSWIKTNKDGTPFGGPGGYTASNLEVCLIGVRGTKMTPRLLGTRCMVPSVLLTRKMEHSVKPPIHHLIDQIYPAHLFSRRVEFFARRPFPGWQVWGNEVLNDDY